MQICLSKKVKRFTTIRKTRSLSNHRYLKKTIIQSRLTLSNFSKSRCSIIRATQLHYFLKEWIRLFSKQPVYKKSVLRALTPFLDERNLIQAAT